MYSFSAPLSTNLLLAPCTPRDTGTSPDRGAHYCPIDYAFPYTYITNAVVTVTPGTVLTFYQDTYHGGLVTAQSAQLLSQGSPTNLVRFVEGLTVQEQARADWGAQSLTAFLLAA